MVSIPINRESVRKGSVVFLIGLILIAPLVSVVSAQTGSVIEDWESGSNTFFNAGSVTTNDPIQGSYAYKNSGNPAKSEDFTAPDKTISFYLRPDNSDDGSINLELEDSGGTVRYGFAANRDGNKEIIDTQSGKTLGTYQVGTWYRFVYNVSEDTLTITNAEDGSTLFDGGVGKNSDIAITNIDILDRQGSFSMDYIETDGSGVPGELYQVSGKVTDSNNNDLSGVSVTAINSDGDVYATDTTDQVGQYSLGLENGTYDIRATKDGYLRDSTTVTVQGNDISGVDLSLTELNSSIKIETRNYLEHGQTADYKVIIENNTGRYNISEKANVTSGNTSVLTVDQDSLTITGTNDTSVNAKTYIKADYTDSKGNNYSQATNVTVANKTVENINILPTGARLGASLEDQTLQVIIVATMIGAGVAFLSRVFAGLAAQTLIMVLGWLGGMVGNGMVIISFMMAAFIGLNVATNVDYNVGSIK